MVNFSSEIKNTEVFLQVSNTDILKVQVNGAGTVQVLGSLNGQNYEPLAGIKEPDFVIVQEISQKGIYSFDINGFEFLQIKKNTPELKVFVVGVN